MLHYIREMQFCLCTWILCCNCTLILCHWGIFIDQRWYAQKLNLAQSLNQVMAWRRTGDKPLFKAWWPISLARISFTRPKYVKVLLSLSDSAVQGLITVTSLCNQIVLGRRLPSNNSTEHFAEIYTNISVPIKFQIYAQKLCLAHG